MPSAGLLASTNQLLTVTGSPALTACRRCRGRARRLVCTARTQDVRELLREAVAAPKVATAEAYRAGAEYLRGQGFEGQEEINRILDIAMNPNSMYRTFRSRKRTGVSVARSLTIESDIRPVLEFLASQGLSQKQIVKIVAGHPPVLCYSPQDRLLPFIQALTAAGIPEPLKTIMQRPTILGLEPDQGLHRIVEYLRENGHSPEHIAELLATTI